MPCKSLVEGVNNSVTACPSLANEGAERGDSVTISLIRMEYASGFKKMTRLLVERKIFMVMRL
jgi:hypothetical protein